MVVVGRWRPTLVPLVRLGDGPGAADLSGTVRLVEEFRGRVIARQDPAFSASVTAAVADIQAARQTRR